MADGRHVLQASNFWHPQYCWRYCRLLVGLSWNWRPPLDNPRDYRYVLIRHLLHLWFMSSSVMLLQVGHLV
jgi:hypothetical protein